MNCRNCNIAINYNYVTDCPQCGSAVERGDLPKLDPSTGQKESDWSYRLANIIKEMPRACPVESHVGS